MKALSNYTLIGTGNMAWFLAQRLTAAGLECKGVYGRDTDAADALATAVGAKVFKRIEEIEDVYDCCIIAISDHAIAAVSRQLMFKDTVVVHTAGSVSLEHVPLPNKAVLWFIYSILKDNFPAHRNIPAIYEASNAIAQDTVLQLARAISDVSYEADQQQRQWLHLTAVTSNNFTNHLLAIAEQLCVSRGLPFSLLLPIIEQTFERVSTTSPFDTQTGPAKRGDDNTIAQHVAILQQHPLWQEVYRAISASIADMYPHKQ